jgi:hypothetical protein
MASCHSCGATLPAEIYRNTTCDSCGADARVCKNCVFYSPGAHWDCRETIPEAVRDKDRANFCDYFRAGQSGAASGGTTKSDEAKRKLDDLFGNG